MHGAVLVLIGFFCQLWLGVYGAYKLVRKIKPPVKIFFLITIVSMVLPLPIKYWFYSLYEGEKTSAYEFMIASTWVTLLPFSVAGFATKKFPKVSNMFYLCAIFSIIYLFILDKHLLVYFNVTTSN